MIIPDLKPKNSNAVPQVQDTLNHQYRDLIHIKQVMTKVIAKITKNRILATRFNFGIA